MGSVIVSIIVAAMPLYGPAKYDNVFLERYAQKQGGSLCELELVFC